MKLPTDKLRQLLSAEADIAGAWLFGSAVHGHVRDGSDIDIGLLFERKPDIDRLCLLRATLQKALEFEEVDIVPLNEAGAVLRFEALSGSRLVCRDSEKCADFASITAREYEDEMAMLNRQLAMRKTHPDISVPVKEEPVRRVAEARATYSRAPAKRKRGE